MLEGHDESASLGLRQLDLSRRERAIHLFETQRAQILVQRYWKFQRNLDDFLKKCAPGLVATAVLISEKLGRCRVIECQYVAHVWKICTGLDQSKEEVCLVLV